MTVMKTVKLWAELFLVAGSLAASAEYLGGLAAPLVPQEITTQDNEGFAALSLTDGNSRTLRLNLGAAALWGDPELWEHRVGGEYNLGQTATEGGSKRDLEQGRLMANSRRRWTGPYYGAVDAALSYDPIADVDYRVTLGPALGADVAASPTARASVETGPGALWERVNGNGHRFVTLRVAQHFEWRMDRRSRLWQRFEWTGELVNPANFLVLFEIGVEASITERTRLRTSLQDRYDSTPAPEARRNDLALATGLAWSFR